MQSKILTALGILVVVVGIGLAIGWFASHGSPQPPPPPPARNESPASNPPLQARVESPAVSPTPGNATPNIPSRPRRPVRPPSVNVITNWDDRLDEILTAETDDTNKLNQLFEMYPYLPEEGKIEVAKHLSNLVGDENYAPLGKLLSDASLPEEALDVLMADLLNRPNNLKLPMFLDIARNGDHPKAEEAKDLLELYLDEDYGTDWPKWETKMKEWLKENPD